MTSHIEIFLQSLFKFSTTMFRRTGTIGINEVPMIDCPALGLRVTLNNHYEDKVEINIFKLKDNQELTYYTNIHEISLILDNYSRAIEKQINHEFYCNFSQEAVNYSQMVECVLKNKPHSLIREIREHLINNTFETEKREHFGIETSNGGWSKINIIYSKNSILPLMPINIKCDLMLGQENLTRVIYYPHIFAGFAHEYFVLNSHIIFFKHIENISQLLNELQFEANPLMKKFLTMVKLETSLNKNYPQEMKNKI